MAVKDISFGVNQRECFGLLGVNGAGKSTTFRMMTGGEVPDSGIMYIGDKNIEKNRKYVSFYNFLKKNIFLTLEHYFSSSREWVTVLKMTLS